MYMYMCFQIEECIDQADFQLGLELWFTEDEFG